jgi:hypothetical protein
MIHEIAEIDDDYNYNLIDIGKVVEKLMGHDFTPFYNDNDFMKQYSNEIIVKVVHDFIRTRSRVLSK